MTSIPSITGRTWRLLDGGREPRGTLRDRLLAHHTLDDIERYFHPSLGDLHDAAELMGIDDALGRLEEALDGGEPIAIFGDYDVDGLTGAAILTEALRMVGGQVSTMVPSRLTDGYGLSIAAVEAAAARGVRVLVTVDCGVSNAAEVARASELGMDVIVCDHHELPAVLPQATAILHPRREGDTYPFKGLTGAGVALKLAQALIEMRSDGDPTAQLTSLLDLAALGTLADMGPLTGENRTLVRLGLEQLSKRERPGLRALLAVSKVEDGIVTEEHVGFQLAPRINAAGRMAHPRTALRLLLATDDVEARVLAAELERLNVERRAKTMELEHAVLARLAEAQDGTAVVLADSRWSVGLLGVAAMRIVEKTHLPTVLFEDRGDVLIGSARTPRGTDVFAPLATCRDLFVRFGGHAQAAGLTLRAVDLPAFKERFRTACASLHAPVVEPDVDLATTLRSDELTIESARTIHDFSPFGPGASRPNFLLSQLRLTKLVPMGDGSHLRLEVAVPGGPTASLTAFGWGKHLTAIREAGTFDAAVSVGSSTYRGVERLDLRVIDLRRSSQNEA
jgi:single-stranded-DNA-specific exonuclease